jgi:hypothetical protein
LTGTSFDAEQVRAGSAMYSRFLLSIYDLWFLWYNCRFLWECPSRVAGRRLRRYKPEVYQRSVTEPFNLNTPAFDSVSMMNLLHCIPGDIKTKTILFEHAKEVMNPKAVFFGATILYKGVKRNAWASFAIKHSNKKGYMFNLDDSLEDIEKGLQAVFSESSVKVIGCEALFWARK